MSAGAASAERRQVTAMFSDLVGSTALSARLDPEDLRELISAYQKCVADTVRRFGGFVAKYMGDGVLVYFGYPQAHEDDPERAVRAGLEMVAAVSGLKIHAPLQTRVGIATGLVVVGDLIGSGASQEQAIVGETPNLAARLQGVAEPNSIVIAESTRRLVGSLFELNDLGSKEMKGISGPVRAWVALRQASVESRFDALHASGLTELVGREEELELLLRRWSKAKTGEGQVVLLSGEPGIGKSRLTAALFEWLAAEPHTRLRYFCSPQHTDSAFYPIITQMERAARFAHDDTAQTKLNKLDGVLAQTFTPRQDAALFADMISQPSDGRYPTLELTAQQRRQRTLEALMRQLEALAGTHPVLMIFEDIHWIDPTSLEALGRTVDRIRTLGVLLIITYRPELEPPWIGQPHVTALTLNRLGQREIEAMIDQVAGNKLLPVSVRQDIIERTDGIPLFVEEMTKALLEAGDQEAERAVAAFPSPPVGVPASLHASLMARLDRLGPVKEVAQIGAVIGREFSHPLLDAVARANRYLNSNLPFMNSLRQVCCSGWVYRPTRVICSSTRWFGTRPTAPSYASRGERFMPVSRKPLKANSQRSPRASRSCWRVITLRPESSRRRRTYGEKQGTGHWHAQRSRRQRSSLLVQFRRLRPYPARPLRAAKRSNFTPRLEACSYTSKAMRRQKARKPSSGRVYWLNKRNY
jgi:class 3 adenylate cyclase